MKTMSLSTNVDYDRLCINIIMYAIVMGDGVGDGWKNVDEKHINLANRINYILMFMYMYVLYFFIYRYV